MKMTLQEAANCLEIDLDTVIARFSGNEALYLRFLKKMPSDPTFFSLLTAVENQDYPEIEREAHTLKGVAANLGLDRLRFSSDRLVQAVRGQEYNEIPGLFEQVRAAHEKMAYVLGQLE